MSDQSGKAASTEELVEILNHVAHMAYRLTLGSVPPWMAAVGARMMEPVNGDLVMETSTYYAANYPADMRIGRLLRSAREPMAIEWDSESPHPTERVFYILGLDGIEHRWTNANFTAVPEADWEKAVVVSDEAVERFQARRPSHERSDVQPAD